MPTSDETPTDSPVGWVADHIRSYVESGGERGHRWNGQDTLLITTTGRRSGQLRRTALIYGRDGDSFVIVASNGGKPQHPLWYTNLESNPSLQVQVGAAVFSATARTVTGEERTRLWALMAAKFPTYTTYAKKAPREIPIVILDPI